MSHRQAVLLMIAVTLMWSIAGVVTRHLDNAQGFELTFWRSLFNALALLVLLACFRGPARLWSTLRQGGWAMWVSGLCWSVMYTAFMVAITLTDVANVLVTMALAPPLTALAAKFALGSRLPLRTWLTIVVAGLGITWMYASRIGIADARHWTGTLVALCVPVAAAINWTLLQYVNRRPDLEVPDMLTPVLIGATLSAAATLAWTLPFAATAHDLRLLALLGVVQLAIPCLLAVRISRVLSAPEMSLLSLLEVVFGVAWVWLFGGETPSTAVLGGGLLVLAALAVNEWLNLRRLPGAEGPH